MKPLACVVLLTALVVVAVTGCGGGSSSTSASQTLPIATGSAPAGPTSPASLPPAGPSGHPSATPPSSAPPTTRPPTNAPPPTAPPTNGPPPTVAPTATPQPGIPKHIPTWAYDEYKGQGSAGTAQQAQTYLTYAEAGLKNSKAVDDCAGSNACYSVYYFDPNFIYKNAGCTDIYESTAFADATESWFVHKAGFTDSKHRLVASRALKCNNVTAPQSIYMIDHYNSGVRSFIETYLQTYADSFDYIFLDETSSHAFTQLYGPGGGMCAENPPYGLCTTSEEYPDDAAVLQGHHLLFEGMTHSNGSLMRLFFNPLTFGKGSAAADDLDLMQNNSNVFGGMFEDYVVTHGTFRPAEYAGVLTTMAVVNATANGHIIQLNIGTDPVGSDLLTGERNIMLAMTWLGYDQQHTIAFPDFEAQSNDLAIWPEYNIVPMNPIQTMSTRAADLQVAQGVYRREFRSCYNFGTPIGPCAAIVNAQTSGSIAVSASWLSQTYGHIITFSGGDIPSGGQVVLNATPFKPSATTIASGHGILLAK